MVKLIVFGSCVYRIVPSSPAGATGSSHWQQGLHVVGGMHGMHIHLLSLSLQSLTVAAGCEKMSAAHFLCVQGGN